MFLIDDLFADVFSNLKVDDSQSLAVLIPGSCLQVPVAVTQGEQSIDLSCMLYPGRVSARALTRLGERGKDIFAWKLLNTSVNFLMTARSGSPVIPFRESEVEYIYFIRQEFDSIEISDIHDHSIDVTIPEGEGVVAINLKQVRYQIALQGSLASYMLLKVNENDALAILILPSADERASIIFRNAWGVLERAELSGMITTEPAYAQRDVFNVNNLILGVFSKQNARGAYSPTLAAQSGFRHPGEIDFLADMLLSEDACIDIDNEQFPVLLSGKVKRRCPIAVPTSMEVKITSRYDESAITPLPPTPPLFLSAEPVVVYLPPDGSEGEEVAILSSSAWSVSGKEAWIHASQDGNRLFVSVAYNASTSARQGTITIVNEEGLSCTISVMQMAEVPYIKPLTNSVTLPVTGQPSVNVDIDANVTWYVFGKPDWVHAEKTSGEMLVISALPNEALVHREGNVVLYNPGMSSTETVYVSILVEQEATVVEGLFSEDGAGNVNYDGNSVVVNSSAGSDGTYLSFDESGVDVFAIAGNPVPWTSARLVMSLEELSSDGMLRALPIGVAGEINYLYLCTITEGIGIFLLDEEGGTEVAAAYMPPGFFEVRVEAFSNSIQVIMNNFKVFEMPANTPLPLHPLGHFYAGPALIGGYTYPAARGVKLTSIQLT